jgi:hypothetical protein
LELDCLKYLQLPGSNYSIGAGTTRILMLLLAGGIERAPVRGAQSSENSPAEIRKGVDGFVAEPAAGRTFARPAAAPA